MNAKQKLVGFVDRIPEDATQEEVLRRLRLYYAVELGLRDIEEGNVIDHDEFFAELLSDNEESETSVVRNARRDLRRLKARIVEQGKPKTANEYLARLKASADRLKDFPESGWMVEEFGNPAIREIVFDSYRLIHRFDGRRIVMIRVFHAAQMLGKGDISESD